MTKVLWWRFQQCFGHFNMFTVHKYVDTGLFMHLINRAFCSPEHRKWINYEAHLFLQMFKNWCRFQNLTKKIRKKFWVLEKIKFELILLNTNFYRERTLVTGSQYVSRFQIVLRQNFSNWSSFRLIKKIWQNYCHEDFSSVLETLTCSVSVSVITRGFLDI